MRSNVSLARLHCFLRQISQDRYVEVGPHDHRRLVLVEYRPPTSVAVVVNADRVGCVDLVFFTMWIPIRRNIENGLGIIVSQPMVDLGGVALDVLTRDMMDECRVQ